MSNNLYWSVYQNLEKELIELTNHIHVDDKQINVYSMKIAELLIRASIEFESLAKELYINNGGPKEDDNNLFFDTDCMKHLNSLWKLESKRVQVVSNNFYFNNDENKLLSPLKKAHKRGSSSEKWLQAYQAIKHNRRTSLEIANIKHLILSMAGLYILNLYYKAEFFELGKDYNGLNFQANCGSSIFSVFIHPNTGVQLRSNSGYPKNNNFDECIYLVVPSTETIEPIKNILSEIEKNVKEELTPEKILTKLSDIIGESISVQDAENPVELNELIVKAAKLQEKELFEKNLNEQNYSLRNAYEKVQFQGVLNRNQF